MEKPWGYHGEWSPSRDHAATISWGLRLLGFLPGDLPRDSIHHDTPSAFQNNVPVFRCRAAGGAALTRVSERLSWSLLYGHQVEWEGLSRVCLFVDLSVL